MPYPRFTKVIINHFISMDKKISMRNRIKLHIIRDDSLLDIKDSEAYKTYYDFATGKVPPRKARKYKKVATPSRKVSPIKESEPVKKAKRVKRPAKKSTTAPTAGVAIRDTPGVFVSNKKAPTKADRSKGSLSEVAQLKEATKRSKKDFYISQANGSGDGTNFELGVPDEKQHKTLGTDKGTSTKPWVPDVPTYDSESENESWGDSEDDNDDNSDDDSKGDDDKPDSDDDVNCDADDIERTDLDDDDDENPSFTLKDYDQEEHDEEYESDDDNENVFEEEHDDLYKDVDKTDDSKQSSSVSSDFANQFLILEKAPPSDHEVASLMNIKMSHKVPSTQIPSPLIEHVMVIPDSSTIASTTVPPTISMISPLPQLTTPSPAPTTIPTTTSIPALPDFSSLFGFDKRVSTLETELSRLKQANLSAQRDRDDKDKDEDPSAGSDRGLKKQKTSKDAKPPKGLKSKESKTSSSKGTKSQPKSFGKSVQAKEPVFETADTKMPQDLGGDTKDQPNDEPTLMDDWFKKPNKPPTPDRHEYSFNHSKSLPLIKAQGHQVVPADYFFNNVLEYLKGGSSSRKYTTSTTKTKAAKYDNIEGIEDMVPTLWSPVKVAYDKFAMWVTHVKVMKWYDYGYLEEIIIRRVYQTLHKFKEGDFSRLNLCDIEDLLLSLVQNKLSNLEKDVIFDLNVALRMFTRCVVILKRVEDLQLGFESYQKKLNLTKPKTFRSNISKMTLYTAYKNPQGIIYLDKYKRNRLMHSDELYKFCDTTLTSVKNVLHDIANNLRMEYLPKRK
uniref:Retrovirus-related Pol polyprotein from transposon TNT 1-94 n=1 Tax=Tanacetum cinerariifolium TaxID=118510 RepID=A0A699GKW1_TANCI|nr:hypothetical protein [Tanacetum cinerariifolium]